MPSENIRIEKAEQLYIICVIIAFGLLFFANAESQEAPDGTVIELGIGKLFYFPCALAFFTSFFLKGNGKQKTNHILGGLIITCAISSILNPPQDFNVPLWVSTRFVAAILCFKDLSRINSRVFVKYLSYASPFIIFPHYFLTNPFSYGMIRYGGFYGDANFLAIALNFLITVCYLSYKNTNSRIVKIISLVSIIGAIPLILLGVSRAGILGLVIVLFFILRDIHRYSPRTFTLIMVVILLSLGRIIIEFADIFEFIRLRFSNENPNDAGGAYARIEVVQSVLNVFSNRPDLIFFGIGPGNTMTHISEYRTYGYFYPGAVHNTYFLVLYEFGLFCASYYIYIFYLALVKLFKMRVYLLFGFLSTVILGLATLPGVTFMPAWIVLFFLMNPQTIDIARN